MKSGPLHVSGFLWRMQCRRRRLDQSCTESGFTLIELLVTIVILPLIVGALAVALIAVFSQQTSVASRVAGSADAQVTSAVFVTDVQGAANFSTDSTVTSPVAQCGTAGTLIFGLNWTNAAGTITTVVSYRELSEGLDKAGNTIYSLFRLSCQSGSVVSSTVLSHDAPANLGLPPESGLTVTCAPAANAPLCSGKNYTSQWITTAGILSIHLQTAEPTTKYTYSLSATPRAWTPQSSGNGGGGNLPLLLLGNSGFTCSGGASPGVSVTGTVATNDTSNGAINLHSGSQLSATNIDTADSSTSIYSGAAPSPAIPISTGIANPDPYSGLPVPTSTTKWSSTTLSASSQPGEYTSAVAVSSNTSFTLPSGIYIFDHGITISGQAVISSAPGGVLFYIAGTQIVNGITYGIGVSGQGGFDLSPIQLPPYTGLTIWQAQNVAAALSLEGNGSGTTVNGAIYAPGASVGGTGNGTLSAGSIVADGLSCAGNGAITINQSG